MKCPIDNMDLVMAERQGIEIDYCPKCRGVWLDRGELDKIIERAGAGEAAAAPAPRAAPAYPARPDERPRYKDDDDRWPDERYGYEQPRHGRPYHKKRKSFLGEIFDFD